MLFNPRRATSLTHIEFGVLKAAAGSSEYRTCAIGLPNARGHRAQAIKLPWPDSRDWELRQSLQKG